MGQKRAPLGLNQGDMEKNPKNASIRHVYVKDTKPNWHHHITLK